jgi:hypothetical protein
VSLALFAVVALALPGAGPTAHAAAVCADYSNQAAAQRAGDTRDGDHDGLYCEALPCPCSTARAGGGTSSTPATSVGTVAPLGLGRSVALHPVTRSSGCHVRGRLPDARCTPGARFRGVTRARVCRSGYSRSVRNVPTSRKDAVYAAYGMSTHFNGANGEVDHLVSLELGGSNAQSNLFPEAAPGSHQKDRLENELHSEVCSGRIGLARAQRLIATDWVAAFRARFG